MKSEQAAHIDELVRAARGARTRRDAVIQESWRRCVSEHRLDPEVLREPCILTPSRLREHQDAMEEFTHTARFGVETLYRQVAGLGYVLLLTDAKGITVDFIGDPTFDNNLMRAGLYLGADWNERHAGTCAVGTCIHTGEPLIVHQTDHFDATHIPLTCTAAPVYDPFGALAAVLDISALRSPEPKESQFLALQFVKGFANKIETAHLMNRFRREWIVKLAASPEFVDVEPSYVLAVDGSGRLLGFNNAARQLLLRELEGAGKGVNLVGQHFGAFFELEMDDLPRFSHALPAGQRLVRLARSGTPLFAATLSPPSRPGRPVADPPAPTLPAPLCALFRDEPAMHRVAARAAKLVNTQMSLLISGETGSGKEYLAKAIHMASARAARPFVPVNCAALPETLVEGELFGYEPGAFTGAVARGKKGLVLEADGGTLFLDEIGDMPLALQTRLLRVLAEREVTPLGRSKPVPVNVRVIAATHRDLVAEVKAGRFREDLYFRLSGAILALPPLRERADIDWLIGRLIAGRSHVSGVPFSVSEAARAALNAHDWPGNIRELANALDYACAVADSGMIGLQDLPDRLHGKAEPRACGRPDPERPSLEPPRLAGSTSASVSTWPQAQPFAREAPARERDALVAALAANGWNISAAARDLGLDRTTVHRRMRRFGLVTLRHVGRLPS